MPTIHLPTPLRPYADKQKTVQVQELTVHGALQELTRAHPQLRQHLFSEQGELRSFVNVYVNDEDIRYLQQGKTTLQAHDVLTIVPSIAGGTGLGPCWHSCEV